MTPARNRTLWTVQVLLALLFIFSGAMKLITPVAEMTKDVALPGAFLHFLGVAEILGGLGLVLPGMLRIRLALTPLAAALLAFIVAAATVITLAAGQGAVAMLPFVTFLLTSFVAWGRSRPGVFRVERSLAIQAPPERIFAHLADFHHWSAWSPWEPRDPAMKKTYSGSPSGEGAVYEWTGNAQVGMGRMEILEAAAPSRLRIKLDFLKPFEGHQTAEFTLAPSAGATTVTWAAFGPTTYLTLVMSIFCSMDDLLGKDFVSGLQNLKHVSEQKVATSV
uniref:DoxX family protein n=1 Tax=Solibacter usitatus (strain Ellin6076) TaxID=234267 RepID=Q01VR7_SOLUE